MNDFDQAETIRFTEEAVVLKVNAWTTDASVPSWWMTTAHGMSSSSSGNLTILFP